MQQPPDAPLPTDRDRAVDPLSALRAELESLTEQPVVDRVERFDHANAVLAAALAELDEV